MYICIHTIYIYIHSMFRWPTTTATQRTSRWLCSHYRNILSTQAGGDAKSRAQKIFELPVETTNPKQSMLVIYICTSLFMYLCIYILIYVFIYLFIYKHTNS